MINPAEAYEYIWSLYKHILRRQPGREELTHWIEKAAQGFAPEDIFQAFVTGKEYRERVAATRIAPKFPPGHYYSPIVDPAETRKYVRAVNGDEVDIPGIKISQRGMIDFWDTGLEFIKTTSLPGEGGSGDRSDDPDRGYPFGDAAILRAMLARYRPSRAIEVGSGSMSACILDAARDAGIANISLTCITPDPEQVRSVLRSADPEQVRIIDKPVQEVPIDIFAGLGPGDLLLIDSTHVLKTGSDVCHELFSVLPSLAKGVIIHFRDCRYPFEYPEAWIFEDNRSWNEIYAVRAFLMYNSEFEIIFWNSLFAISGRAHVAATVPAFLEHPGAGLWIERGARRAAIGV